MVTVESIKFFVNDKFEAFGKNKRQDIVRLLYEITKRDKCDIDSVFVNAPESLDSFANLKQYLLAKRFPNLTDEERNKYHSLPEVNIDLEDSVAIAEKLEMPYSHFYVESSVEESDLAKRIRDKFPNAEFTVISNYKDHVSKLRHGIPNYNNRLQNIFIVRELYDFFPKCPCTPSAVPCGYYIMGLGQGCPFECSYCFLQSYTNSPGIVIPANIEDFLSKFNDLPRNIRLGTGEFADSLFFDPITEYSPIIIKFFRKRPESIFEFKTKSTNIQLILSTPPADNIVISWSLNPQNIINENEFYAASLIERFTAARKCAEKGYKVGFHFDPIIYYSGWERDYQDVVDKIFEYINPKRIAWISLGTLRMTIKQKTVIETRFPFNTILDGELIAGYDEKLRYPSRVRTEIYKKMLNWITKRSFEVDVYLCMEDKKTYHECGLSMPFTDFAPHFKRNTL